VNLTLNELAPYLAAWASSTNGSSKRSNAPGVRHFDRRAGEPMPGAHRVADAAAVAIARGATLRTSVRETANGATLVAVLDRVPRETLNPLLAAGWRENGFGGVYVDRVPMPRSVPSTRTVA